MSQSHRSKQLVGGHACGMNFPHESSDTPGLAESGVRVHEGNSLGGENNLPSLCCVLAGERLARCRSLSPQERGRCLALERLRSCCLG